MDVHIYIITCSKPPVIWCCSNRHIPLVASGNKVLHRVMKVWNKIERVQELGLPHITPISPSNADSDTGIGCVCVSGCIIVESVQHKICEAKWRQFLRLHMIQSMQITSFIISKI